MSLGFQVCKVWGLRFGIPGLAELYGTYSVLPPPLSNSWIISILWLYIALNGTPNVDCYWGGGGSTQSISFDKVRGHILEAAVSRMGSIQMGPLLLEMPKKVGC